MNHHSSRPTPRIHNPGALLGVSCATVLFALIIGVASLSAARSSLAMVDSSNHAVSGARPAQLSACVGCHGGNLKGRVSFSPDITQSGILKKYTKKTFERVMNTGITYKDAPVAPPMKAFHFTAPISDSLYKYLKTH